MRARVRASKSCVMVVGRGVAVLVYQGYNDGIEGDTGDVRQEALPRYLHYTSSQQTA